MFDQDKLLNHLHREEDRVLGSHILDKCEQVLKYHKTQASDFLNPYQIEIAAPLIEQIAEINFKKEGGYPAAERKRIVIFPEYLFPDLVERQIKIYQLDGNFAFQKLTHRDFLGALMGLGLQRKVIGDILVHPDFAQIITAVEVEDIIELKLEKVHQVPVEVKEIDESDIVKPTQHEKEILTTVASMRLDAVASSGFGDSRNRMSRDIENGKVKLNWKVESDPAAEVEIGDLISVRGRGRVKVEEDRGISNKGRIKLTLKRLT
ncbi:MAG: RNA-binding protein [Halanaerobium sp.]